MRTSGLLVFLKEVARLKERVPLELGDEYVVADVVRSLDLVDHDAARRVGDVECGVLLRIGRRDNRHEMELVHRVVARVPYGKPVRRQLFERRYGLEDHRTSVHVVYRVRPYPIGSTT